MGLALLCAWGAPAPLARAQGPGDSSAEDPAEDPAEDAAADPAVDPAEAARETGAATPEEVPEGRTDAEDTLEGGAQEAGAQQTVPAPPADGDPSDPAYYRGRRNPTPPEETLAWIPRVLFAPVTLVTEFVIRRPLAAFFEWAVRNHIFDGIDELLHPHPDVTWGPTLSFEANVLALPGIRGEWRNALFPGHEVEASFAMAATDFWAASVRDEWHFGPVFFGARGGNTTRPERPFYGLGPASGDRRAYYSLSQVEAYGYLGLAHEMHAKAQLSFGYSREETGPGITPSVQTILPLNDIPGFGLYELGIGMFDLTLDTRNQLEDNGGVRFVGNTTFGYDARNPSGSFMTVELDLEAGVEVSYPDRVLVGRVYAMNTLPFGDAPIPLHRLAWLGFDRHRGFVRGRFRGEAAILVEARYRYPVNYYADLQWIASVGNVFARDGSDFDLGALTGTLAVGIRTRRTGMAPLDVSIGLGTSRFDAGFSVESVRVLFESTNGL